MKESNYRGVGKTFLVLLLMSIAMLAKKEIERKYPTLNVDIDYKYETIFLAVIWVILIIVVIIEKARRRIKIMGRDDGAIMNALIELGMLLIMILALAYMLPRMR